MTTTDTLAERTNEMIQDTFERNFMWRSADEVRRLLIELNEKLAEKEDKK